MRNFVLLIVAVMMAARVTAASPPDDFVARYQAAVDAHRAQDYAAMERELQAALALRPGHPTASYQFAAALARQGKSDAAIDQLRVLARQGLTFDPKNDPQGDFASLAKTWSFRRVLDRFERNRKPVGEPRSLFRLLDPTFIPEGIAFDEDRKHYFVGSVRHRRIQRVTRGGEEMDFVQPGAGGLWAPLGMAADAPRRLLWVAMAAIPEMLNAQADELGQTGVIAYHLDTGQRRARYLLKAPGEHQLHDLVVLRSGTIYLTDSKAGLLWSLDSGRGTFEPLTEPGQLASPRGLAISDDRKTLYVADYTQGLFRYEIESRRLERMAAEPEISLYGIDGLARWRDELIAVQTGVRPHRIVRLTLKDRGRQVRRAEVLASNVPEFDEPTSGVVVGNRFNVIANSQWSRFTADHQLPSKAQLRRPLVLRIPLDEREDRDEEERDRGRAPDEGTRPTSPLRLPITR